MVDFGTDIESTWTPNPQGDFKLISDVENAKQAIINRLLTQYDELASLGYTGYGNKSHELAGLTDIKLATETIKIHTHECLLREPRVNEILNIECTYNNKVITVDISIKMIDEDHTENMIITHNMEA